MYNFWGADQKSDFIFKKIFGDAKNVEILEAFLKSILDIPHNEYESLTLTDMHLKKRNDEDKLRILDVKVQTKSGNTIDIEIQLANIPHIRERVVFYLSKMINEQISSGDKYDAIKMSIIILITNFDLIDANKKYCNCYTLHDKNDGNEFTNLLEVDTLELSKLPQKDDNTELWSWLKFLKSENEEEFEMIETKSPELKKAVCIVRELSQDEETRLQFETREKARMDYEDRMDGAYEAGGVNQKIKDVIVLVSKYNIPLNSAMSDFDLDISYKSQIIDELNKRNIKYSE